jgi:carboxypeptidase C (cathepsin A)
MRIAPAALACLILIAAAPLAAQETHGQGRRERPATEQRTQRPAAEQRNQGAAEQRAQSPGVLRLLPADTVREKSITLGGRAYAYTATAGTFPLYDQGGEQTAAVFYTAYAVKDADARTRPVTFVFNGGPGAASAFLNLGLAGPRILELGPDGREAAALRLRDNPDSWLAFTDLVMIDPVGSGWSRAAKADGAGAFYGVQRDADSIAKVIMLYLSRNGRLGSPKFLLGESYGGFRAAKVARALQAQQGVIVNGIVMVSPMLDGALTFSLNRTALGSALRLPALAATALDRKGALTDEALAGAERFAFGEYLSTLVGAPPQGEAARAFYARVAELTGLPLDVVARARGFISRDYDKHLRRDDSKVVSAYDASFAAPDPFPERASDGGGDPVLDGFARALGGAFVAYAREELGFHTEMTFHLLGPDVAGKWDWGAGWRNPPTVSDDLRQLLARPDFRLLVSHGYSDMVTTYTQSKYVLDHIPVGDPGRKRLVNYRGGHMFYFDDAARKAFTKEAEGFYKGEM